MTREQLIRNLREDGLEIYADQVKEVFDYLERDVLTHHSQFVKLLCFIVKGWSLEHNLTYGDSFMGRKLQEIFNKPFKQWYEEIADTMHEAEIHREVEQTGRKALDYAMDKDYLRDQLHQKWPQERFGDLADRVTEANWELYLERKANLDKELNHPMSDLSDKITGKKRYWTESHVKDVTLSLAWHLLVENNKADVKIKKP